MPFSSFSRFRRSIVAGLLVILALVLIATAVSMLLLRASRAQLDGERRVAGLGAAVEIERDGHGVPRLRGESRSDLAFALGFVHAQERFFQMDLLRRRAAGELAELVGPPALELDRRNRLHDFRGLAGQVVAGLPPRHRRRVEAYTAGVNEGLDALRVRPFEYLLLRRSPEPWRVEDCALVISAMCLELSLNGLYAEEAAGLVMDTLPPAVASWLLPWGNRWEAPLQGGPGAVGAIPDSTRVDLRRGSDREGEPASPDTAPPRDGSGSNSWAVSGRWTQDGRAILSNDMHLGLGLPNIWYRAVLEWPTAEGRVRRLAGVTLPGTPAVVVGSNGRVAWGLTNAYGDFADLVLLDTDSDDPARYRTSGGWRPFAERREVFEVRGAVAETLRVKDTIWGPVWDRDPQGRWRALRWSAHDSAAVDFDLLDLEAVDDVEEAVMVASRMGIPPQNFVCADADGRIAWTVAGRLPARVGTDGRRPLSWADGERRWEGYLDPSEQPRIVDPPEGRLWTANARVADGEDLARIGDGGYALGARARQIRDGLRALEAVDEGALLELQLDDRALFLEPWRELALSTLEAAPHPLAPPREEFERLLLESWDGRASIGSVGYRLTRSFWLLLVDEIYEALLLDCQEADPEFDERWLSHRSAVVWQLLESEPAHLLAPPYASWQELRLEAIDRVVEIATADGEPLSAYRWGRRNTVQLRHPLAAALPFAHRWLSLPARELPGDSRMPRVQHPTHGASERLVVSPGREEQALFHMPGGQSGHPSSPHFGAGHRDWEEGRPTPLLAREAEHRLLLRPDPRRRPAGSARVQPDDPTPDPPERGEP